MTTVYFCYDTEDFTSNYASGAILRQGQILRSHGVKGNFNIVGYLARELVRNRRFDVLDELRNHTISFHSLRHSYHPDIMEYTDRADYASAAYELAKQENEGMGMVKAATGVDHFPAAVPPGDCVSYVALYHYADEGIPLYLGAQFETIGEKNIFYCNAFQVDYHYAMEELFIENETYDRAALLDEITKYKRVIIMNHPNKVLYETFWDAENYLKENQNPMFAWREPKRRPKEDVEKYYARLDDLVGALKADPRFEVGCVDDLADWAREQIYGRTVKKTDLPLIRESLEKHFSWLDAPTSLSVADCFLAAKHFLFSEQDFHPGKVRGFLYTPSGVTEKMTLTANEVREIACKIDEKGFLPPYYTYHGKKIGPADLLFAMLDAAMGKEEIVLLPKDQMCDASRLPTLENQYFRHTWMHGDALADNVLGDRLRLQAWTIREE